MSESFASLWKPGRRIALAAGLLLIFLAPGSAAQGQAPTLTVSSPQWKGFQVGFLTRIEPQSIKLPGGVFPDSDRAHHTISDNTSKRLFGYDLLVEPSADGLTAKLILQPLSPKFSVPDRNWTLVSPPRYPTIAGVRVGETVAIDLLVNPSTGQKVVDYLTLLRSAPVEMSNEPAREIALADVELTVQSPRILLNGRPLAPEGGDTEAGASGEAVGIYMPGFGRFAVSLLPHKGFQRLGVVSGNKFRFQDGASTIEVTSQSRIVPASGVFHLYVNSDRNWVPRDRLNDQFALEAGPAGWVTRR